MTNRSKRVFRWAIACAALGQSAMPAYAQSDPTVAQETPKPIATFVPNDDRIEHRIDYSIWTSALNSFVISMGPPLRKKPFELAGTLGTRQRAGHNSLYRLDGAMMGFSFMPPNIIASFTEYREDLERVADGLDIQSIPRNEQLAFWLNLHNVAMVEQVAKAWPVRQPRTIELDGVPLDDAKFITVEGVALSPKDIRTRIVYPNWSNAKVIYGFWHGEIGGPAIQRRAYEANKLSDQLDRAAKEFANSRRGVEKRGKTLHVSRLYLEAAPFYFTDFETDLRDHLLSHVEGEVLERVNATNALKATLREHDIADLSGGARFNSFFSNGKLNQGIINLLNQRAQKLDYIQRKGLRTGTVTFSNIILPGDDPNKGEVE
ncbi:DUF547 domain-containing protein [Erythrobacter crassostreae]|uniref:DUF547 domain-containing protein n=1 Tax=Erythrobacter crassostreae TaxID=2828328 RepID=A0A9X1F1V6_9SPHN|nr:DUF547 domain-containing protein [Erythrobacter crassostrea]MBV7257983.1 DUF547 domain-containing protein [Erythrobacter crassostrea]